MLLDFLFMSNLTAELWKKWGLAIPNPNFDRLAPILILKPDRIIVADVGVKLGMSDDKFGRSHAVVGRSMHKARSV